MNAQMRVTVEELDALYEDFAAAVDEAERRWYGVRSVFLPVLMRGELLLECAWELELDLDDAAWCDDLSDEDEWRLEE